MATSNKIFQENLTLPSNRKITYLRVGKTDVSITLAYCVINLIFDPKKESKEAFEARKAEAVAGEENVRPGQRHRGAQRTFRHHTAGHGEDSWSTSCCACLRPRFSATRPHSSRCQNRRANDLHALIRAVLAPYLHSNGSMKRERLIVKGCDVPMAEKAVSSLALVLHELATNSVKLGSLSLAKGGVRVDCSSTNDQVRVSWKEQRGPRLNGPPQHEGFGSLLANRIVTEQFGGEISYNWKPAGLVVQLSAPIERITG
jgi:hypothetical protein